MGQRTLVIQDIAPFALSVGTTAVPLGDQAQIEGFIDSILINVISTAAQSVFFGNASVTIASGVEIQAGVIFNLALNNERVLYELEQPLNRIAASMQCAEQHEVQIPVVVWDLSQVFLVAAAATDVRIMAFKSAYL